MVVGAGHGIGLALVRALLNESLSVKVVATYRNESKAAELLALAQSSFGERVKVFKVDPTEESQLLSLEAKIDAGTKFDLLIISVGILHDGQKLQPERSLREITAEGLSQSFRVNAIVTPLVAKYFMKRFDKNAPAVFAALSAKVGSIGDNRLGGWYGYRASKAALNMFTKTIAIEFTRQHFSAVSVMAIHPGTTETELSQPFLANVKYKVLQTGEAAKNILSVMERSYVQGTGLFKDWDGADLPW